MHGSAFVVQTHGVVLHYSGLSPSALTQLYSYISSAQLHNMAVATTCENTWGRNEQIDHADIPQDHTSI